MSHPQGRGETFFLKLPLHIPHQGLTRLAIPKLVGDIFITHQNHLEGCTEKGISKDAQKQPEGCTEKNITKDAHQNAPRRIPKTKQLSETIARTVRRLSRVTTMVSTVKLQRITTGPAQVLCHAASGTSKAESLPAHQWHSAVHILHHGNIYKPST